MFQQRLGHLRTSRVPGAQEQHAWLSTSPRGRRIDLEAGHADRGVKCGTGRTQQFGETGDVALVVGVASVGRALPGRYEAPGPQLAKVIRHQALGLADQLAELADTSIAPTELVQELPPQRVGDELQELEGVPVAADSRHATTIDESTLMHQAQSMQLHSTMTRVVARHGRHSGDER
jgi:hypothetical protein